MKNGKYPSNPSVQEVWKGDVSKETTKVLDINSKKDISTSLTLYNFSLAWRKLLLQLVHLVEMTELQTTAFAEQTKSLAIQVLRGPPEVCKY
jgi:hypothetical protein